MPGDLHYAAEKYGVAVDLMALGRGELRDRLRDAYMSQAMRVQPRVAGLGPPMSEELATRIERFDESMTSVGAIDPSEGSIQATVRSLSDEEVEDRARELMSISRAIRSELNEL